MHKLVSSLFIMLVAFSLMSCTPVLDDSWISDNISINSIPYATSGTSSNVSISNLKTINAVKITI